MDEETQEILNDFLTETTEMIDGLDQKFVELETQPDNKDLLNEIFRAMHSMKGSAGFLGFNHLVDVTHRAESILNKLRQGEMAVVPEIITVILETVDTVKLIMTEIRTSGSDVKIPVDAMSQKLDDILAGKFSGATAAPSPATPPSPAPVVAASAPEPVHSAPPPPQLGEILVTEGLATKEQVFDALREQSKQADPKQPLGELLIQAKAMEANARAMIAEAGRLKKEAERMQALSNQGSQSIAYMNAQAALNISEGIKNGKVQTIVVPANFNALMMGK